jgi:hypothetical protein
VSSADVASAKGALFTISPGAPPQGLVVARKDQRKQRDSLPQGIG